MTDPSLLPDDEIVSAVLDGEATPAEVARVENDPALRDRLAQMAAVRELVAAPVVPLDEVSRQRLLSAALDHAETDGPSAPHPPAPLPGALPWWRRNTAWIGSAAAVVVLALLVGPALVGGWGEERTDEASVAFDAATEGSEPEGIGTLADHAGGDADHEAEMDDSSGAPSDEGAGSDTAGGPTSTTLALDRRVYPDLATFRDQVERDGALVGLEERFVAGYEASNELLVELRDRCGSLVSDHVELPAVLQAEGWVDGVRLVAIAAADPGDAEVVVTVFDPMGCAVVEDD